MRDSRANLPTPLCNSHSCKVVAVVATGGEQEPDDLRSVQGSGWSIPAMDDHHLRKRSEGHVLDVGRSCLCVQPGPKQLLVKLAFGVGVLAGVVRIDILRALESIRELQPGVQAGRVAASASVQMGVAVVIFHAMFLAFAIAGRLHLLGLRPPRP